MNVRSRRALVAFVCWAFLIFITSCFVVPFDSFVHFVQRLLPGSMLKSWFAGFWLVGWIFVVKGWHAAEYFLLTIFCGNLLRARARLQRTQTVLAAFGFAVLFAASDEWHQTFVKGRDGNVRDVFIDSCGALIAALLMIRRRKV